MPSTLVLPTSLTSSHVLLTPQARDLLQHLWTGPISTAPVDIVQGSKSVEVRPVGISKVRGRCTSELAYKSRE